MATALFDKDTEAFVEQYKGLNSNGRAVLAAAAKALLAYSAMEEVTDGKEQKTDSGSSSA